MRLIRRVYYVGRGRLSQWVRTDPVRRLHWSLGIPDGYEERGLPRFNESATLARLAGTRLRATPDTCRQWAAMRQAAANDGVSLYVMAGYRSYAAQAQMIRGLLIEGVALHDVMLRVAAPGYSEHHTGRALDIRDQPRHLLVKPFEETDSYAWLCQHAGTFGFQQTYAPDNRYGILFEPWHWCLQEGFCCVSDAGM